jgi:hypothetical protein
MAIQGMIMIAMQTRKSFMPSPMIKSMLLLERQIKITQE